MVGTIEEIVQRIFQFDKDKKYEIKEYKNKRSKSQNAYMWELINEIANITRLSKEQVYKQMLEDYSQSQIVSVLAEIDVTPYFKYSKKCGESILNGKKFYHYKVFKGSSEMDSREMTILIDGVIQEAKQLNIDTLTPAQVAEMRLI